MAQGAKKTLTPCWLRPCLSYLKNLSHLHTQSHLILNKAPFPFIWLLWKVLTALDIDKRIKEQKLSLSTNLLSLHNHFTSFLYNNTFASIPCYNSPISPSIVLIQRHIDLQSWNLEVPALIIDPPYH